VCTHPCKLREGVWLVDAYLVQHSCSGVLNVPSVAPAAMQEWPTTKMNQHVCHTVAGTAQHITSHHSTAQHSTAQHSTAQHSTPQHNPAQLDICCVATLMEGGSSLEFTPHSTARQHVTCSCHCNCALQSLEGWCSHEVTAHSTAQQHVMFLCRYNSALRSLEGWPSHEVCRAVAFWEVWHLCTIQQGVIHVRYVTQPHPRIWV
jgi:hypothetical protein